MEQKEKKVVLFPNLPDLLRDKGFESLHNKEFAEAFQCFEQLRQHGLADERSEFAEVVCLMEMHQLREARERCEALLEHANETFSDTAEMYLTILVQLHEYQRIAQAVPQLLRGKLSGEQAERLQALHSFAEKMQGASDPFEEEEDDVLHAVFQGHDVMKQLQALQELKQRGAVRANSFLRACLADASQHPYVKSVILYALMESGVQEEITVAKFGEELSVVPVTLRPAGESEFARDVLRALEQELGMQNPSMFEALSSYWQEILYVFFPFQPAPSDVHVWAAVLSMIGGERFEGYADPEEISRAYGVPVPKLQEAYEVFLAAEQGGTLPV